MAPLRAICLLLASALLPHTALSNNNLPSINKQLVSELRKGGYVLYVRHASTDYASSDQPDLNLDDCSTQRVLSPKGRSEAQEIGSAIRQLEIPVDEVLSSPYCRCTETAQLIFGKYAIDNNLQFAMSLNQEQTESLSGWLKHQLSIAPQSGTNRVLVAHTANLREATGYWPKPEGVIFVFKPEDQGQFRAIARIPPSDWVKTQVE